MEDKDRKDVVLDKTEGFCGLQKEHAVRWVRTFSVGGVKAKK